MSLICPNCGQGNREGARFCAGCGGALAVACLSCGADLPAGARFCDACGAPVSQTDPVGSDARKVVSVVFADLAGSTAMHEALDAESVRRVMARFYEVMAGAVEGQDGRVEKFVGDAVVASFGVRGLHEDDALRAVRAAAAMQDALVVLNEELERGWGVRLHMRIGVNTGELVVSADGELVGDMMNTAARLEQAAGAGEVLVGEATWRLVHHAAELESVVPLELKGKAGLVRAWRLISASAVAGAARASTVEAPLVGRDSELARLRAGVERVLAERACRLVTVMGSPGLGKTRLASELATVVSDRARIVVGHCEPTGEGITFLPVAEVLRTVAGIGEADPAELVREKLLVLTSDDEPDRDRLVERLAGVLGIVKAASAQETFWALRRGLEFLARERPLVLVLDDLHWGQPMLLDLVEHLVEWVRDAPVLIVALARPELRDAREALAFAGRRASEVIELEPLDEGQSRELVSGLLGDVRVPPMLSARILQTTEGNPLFLSETVRMLVDEGVLRRDGDAWVAADDAAMLEVPPTIQALLAARIERLRGDERSVVERAAVIGKQFYRGAVAELVAPPVRAGIDSHLEALRRKDMVEPDGTYWIDEPVYRFHHVLIRDAAYRSLLKQSRAELHERFADWLEVKAGELVGEHEEVIAFHLEQAHAYRGELGALNEGGRALGARAAARLHSAGCRALAREDLAAAANLLGRALAREAGDEQEILWDLCEAVLLAGDTSRAVALVRRFAHGGDADPRRPVRATVLEGQLANLTGAGDIGATAERVAAAAAELNGLGDRTGEAKAWQVAAGAYARLGRVGRVEEALDRALAAARAADDSRRTTAALAGAPRAALWGPSPVVRASGRCLDVVRILRMRPGNRHVEAIALRCQAVLEAMRGRPDAAREILATARATLQELGLSLELHETAVHQGMVELLDGAPAAAAEHLRAARAGFEALGVGLGAAQAAALLARALLELGDSDAEALAQTRFAEQHGGGDLKTRITWISARAQSLARAGSFEPALELARRAASLAEPTDALADKADASMALAHVLYAAGLETEARDAASAASRWYEAKGHVVGAERAAKLVGEPGESARAATPTDEPAAGRGLDRLSPRAPERWLARLARINAERDMDGLLSLYADDYQFADHRSVGWEPRSGRQLAVETVVSIWEGVRRLVLDVDEVLACDDRTIAARITWSGTASEAFGGGDWSFPLGVVVLMDGDQAVRFDQYEATDTEAMLTRYTELSSGVGPAQRPRAELVHEQGIPYYNAHDLKGLMARHHERVCYVDHRELGWEPLRGLAEVERFYGSAFAISPDIRQELDEVLASDDRLVVAAVTFRGTGADGGGEFELRMGYVTAFEDGLIISSDFYDHDDRQALMARYRKLGGRLAPAPETKAAPDHATWLARHDELLARGDFDALADELLAADVLVRDRRGHPTPDARGPDAYRALIGSGASSSVLAVDGEHVLIRRDDDPPLLVVAELRDGRLAQAIVLRDEERAREWLTALKLMRNYQSGELDIERLMAIFHPEARLADHRPLHLHDAVDSAEIREFYLETGRLLERPRASVEVLDVHPGAMAAAIAWSGIDRTTGGAVEWRTFNATRLRDGLAEEVHIFADAEPALAKAAELAAAAGAGPGARDPTSSIPGT